jgi:hypothetical protein
MPNDAPEKLFQDQVARIARMHGWLVFHSAPFMVRPGVWRTSGKGFPDLVMVCPFGRGVVFAELKTEVGKLTEEQLDWGTAHVKSGGEYYVWRPADLQLIADRLSQRPKGQAIPE